MSMWNVDPWSGSSLSLPTPRASLAVVPDRAGCDEADDRRTGRSERGRAEGRTGLRPEDHDLTKPVAAPETEARRARRGTRVESIEGSAVDFALLPNGWTMYLIPSRGSAPEVS